MSAAELDLRHFTHEDLPQIRQTIIEVHDEAQGDDWEAEFKKKFPWFVDHWGGNPEYSCVIAYHGEEAVGFACGAPAAPHREWWREHLDPVPEKTRTFSYPELAVSTKWRKQDVMELLSRTLLECQKEDLAVLLVDVEHPRVQARYESWGFQKIGERRPFPGSPVYAVMLAELPLS
ncbi:GNAT family N-acetyltransferase [Streptomyces sp. NPDC059743]|uniref:GNAT family N-acetyltransferase n=1 Tax=Streptomyces sp. NPDC059743 TaxID=3346928 RepID=UPI0036464FEF